MAWFTSELLSDIVNRHAPMKNKMVRKESVPYMNSQLRKAQYSRNMARNKFRKYGKRYWEENRRARNKAVALRKESMANYFSKGCAKRDKDFWQMISPFMSNKRSTFGQDIILNENNQLIVEAKSVADIFNNHFTNIASNIGFDDEIISTADAIAKHAQHPSVLKILGRFSDRKECFKFYPVSASDIEKKLKSLNVRKATGYDNIPGKLLRLAHKELAMPLTTLINKCISHSVFPAIMKSAEVSPVYKKADNLEKGNYRPVSILTTLSKLHEYALNDQMVDYFSALFNNLLSAFRKGYSCQTLLTKCIDDWKLSLDNGNIVGAIFMDLSKAFDCLPHSLTIAKLHAYGMSTSACDLISSYLSNRKQRIKIGCQRSDWKYISKGVPQGSILGPLLFNIFMNDLFMFIQKCILYNYADDNSMSHAATSLTDVINSLELDAANALTWFDDNGMQANPDKFQYMIISSRDTASQDLCINGNVRLSPASHVKALGVTIDNRLNFTEHVSSLCTKAARQLNALSRISRYLDETSRAIIYNSFVASNFSHCPLVWHFCGKGNNDKLEKIQERALKIIYRNYSMSYQDLLDMSNSSTLQITRERLIALEVFKCIRNMSPDCLSKMFQIKDKAYSFRNPIRLVQPKRNTTTYGLRSISYVGANIWNRLQLPFCDVNDISIEEFKRFVKTWNGANNENNGILL